MIDLLVSLVAVVTLGLLVLCGGVWWFISFWARQEDRQRRLEAAERVTFDRIMAADRPSWRAQQAREFNRKDVS